MFNTLKPVLAGAALAISAAFATAPGIAAEPLKLASGYPDASYLTQTLREFLSDVETATNGEVTVTLHNNQSLVKLQDISNAVRRNQVQMGQVYTANLGNQDAMFTLDAIPFLAPDEESAVKLWEAQKPYIDAWFERQGMRVLFPQFFPPQGFYTKAPVATAADLQGLSMRIYSNATQTMANLLGAKPLQVQFGEVPQAFATGLIEAMFTSPQTGIDVQAWDFTSHYNLVGAMRTKLLVVINEDEFQKLSETAQQALLDASDKAMRSGLALGASVTEEQLATLESHGVEVTRANDAFRAELQKVGETMTAEWREQANEAQRAVLEAYLASRN